ncbi:MULTISPECIES: ATP-binding cassette domain-containing protein [unclassified Parafrankia]|uniref:ATP-binding cassette domain-containing protein n=1 Tax=unclassified Parafrankia TaxID=2994368 RepID=UPI000DA523DC|nr:MULTISPECIES: ATP-binding cassette domain-containing protein [unclassified Parafrankia]TCJ33503.1 ATP-binding cassette domain-containing protein [Parafrankia sp. BMG5.11]SQD97726.1 ABC transporter ATP-binding protein/permease [Parafrankia sp. Ea1.12]
MTQSEVVDDDRLLPTADPRTVVLRLDQIEKRYPGVHALKGVSLRVHAGEIHALVGENGAGKSTLVGVAAGSVRADTGTVEIGSAVSEEPSPEWAREAGLAIVYQEPALLPDLTVAQNMALAMPQAQRPALRAQGRWAREILDRWQSLADIDPSLPVRELRPDARFVVEIGRALAEQPRVIVLDEPTEHLLPAAVEELFRLVREHVEHGGAVVYISHRLGEVMRIAHTISVLRDGALVGTFDRATVSEPEIVNLVVGHEVTVGEHRASGGDVQQTERFAVRGLSGQAFHDVTLSVRAGEILGFAGIEGQGQREVLRALAGLEDGRGEVRVNDRKISTRNPSVAQRGGVLYLPQDRHNEGVFAHLSLRENAAVTTLRRLSRWGLMSTQTERRAIRGQFEALRVKAPSMDVEIASLSGGNQQKVVLSRVLLAGSQVILADEPTQGVDVGAREEIYEILRETARRGIAVIVLSSSSAELAQICDRVVVFSRGQVVAELEGAALTDHGITQAALTASRARASAAEDEATRPAPAANSVPRRLARNDLMPSGVLALAILVLGVVAVNHTEFYLTQRNFSLVLPLLALLAFLAMGQQMVMLVGGIDLSVGPLASFLVVVGSFSLAAYRSPAGMVFGVVLLVLVAAAAGTVNWVLASVLKISPIMATLVTFTLLQGLAFLLRPLPAGRIDPVFLSKVQTTWGFVPVMMVLAIAVAIGLEAWLRLSSRGVRLRAVGSNPRTAERIGLSSRRASLVAYVGCSVLVVPAALLLMAQARTGNPSIGDSYTLSSIAAVVLGGASIFGGRGSFVGALVGAALITQVNTVVQFLGLELYWQQWLLAGLTIVSVALYSKTRSLMTRSVA